MSTPEYGWQSPARPPKCPHFGLLFAALAIHNREQGDRWRCTCGAMFVVRIRQADGRKYMGRV